MLPLTRIKPFAMTLVLGINSITNGPNALFTTHDCNLDAFTHFTVFFLAGLISYPIKFVVRLLRVLFIAKEIISFALSSVTKFDEHSKNTRWPVAISMSNFATNATSYCSWVVAEIYVVGFTIISFILPEHSIGPICLKTAVAFEG